MNCQECQEQLPSYIEQELTPLDRGRLEAHVDSCAACQGELTELKKVVNGMRTLPAVAVPSNFRGKVWQRIESPSVSHRLREWILEPGPLRLPVGALATAVVAILVVQVSRTTLPQLQRRQLAPSQQSLMVGWAPELAESTYSDAASLKNEYEAAPIPAVSQVAEGLSDKNVFSRIYTAPLYYIRWQVADLKGTPKEINRLIRDISIRQVKRPQPHLYYLVMSLEKFEAFMDQLHSIGEPALVKPLTEFPSDFPPELPEEDQAASSVRWVVLELNSAN